MHKIEEVETMKRRILVISILLVLIFIIPIPIGQAKDGGTKRYVALTYQIVDWNHFYGDNKVFDETKVYFFPDNFCSLDELIEREINH